MATVPELWITLYKGVFQKIDAEKPAKRRLARWVIGRSLSYARGRRTLEGREPQARRQSAATGGKPAPGRAAHRLQRTLPCPRRPSHIPRAARQPRRLPALPGRRRRTVAGHNRRVLRRRGSDAHRGLRHDRDDRGDGDPRPSPSGAGDRGTILGRHGTSHRRRARETLPSRRRWRPPGTRAQRHAWLLQG